MVADQYDTADAFAAASVEDRAVAVLNQVLRAYGPRRFAPSRVSSEILAGWGQRGASERFLRAYSEAFEWIRVHLLCAPDLTQNTYGTWFILTEAGLSFNSASIDVLNLRRILPEFLLHPRIRRFPFRYS